MFGRLMPREGNFFELFNAHAERIVEGSRELAAMIGTFSELEAHAQEARLRAQLPGGEATSSIYDYQHAAAQRAGARFELGVAATASDIIACQPDAVILATGATMVPPRWLPLDAHDDVRDLRATLQQLAHIHARQPGTAVIDDRDQSEATYAGAERLRQIFERVIIVTPRDAIAEDTSMVTHQGINRRLSKKLIKIKCLHEPRWSDAIAAGALDLVHVYTGESERINDLALLTYATPRAPDIALLAPLRAAGISVQCIGDCLTPRNVMAATAEGHAAGHAV